jgi:hypothetical protein
MPALFRGRFHKYASLLIAVNAPETLTMGTGDLGMGRCFSHEYDKDMAIRASKIYRNAHVP